MENKMLRLKKMRMYVRDKRDKRDRGIARGNVLENCRYMLGKL